MLSSVVNIVGKEDETRHTGAADKRYLTKGGK
jgi:hypothetical protein